MRVVDHELLVQHAVAWADGKSRSLDPEMLTTVLELRRSHDDLSDGAWAAGSAERLLLVTWPAYGPPPPAPEPLCDTLDTFWRFLRATGRLTGSSASPAELRKEAGRAAPRMTETYDDPAHHSQGRVLADFGRSVGIDLDDPAEDLEELQGRLDRIQAAWNQLPQEERIRRMPDPSPKSQRGAAFTQAINAGPGRPHPVWPEADDDDSEEVDGLEPGDVHASAGAARSARFVQDCLRLADWVDAGREVTQRGLLRPQVARTAYQELDLWSWERRYDALQRSAYGAPETDLPPEADELMARVALTTWRSAGDCLPLDRLWYAAVSADLIELGSARAVSTPVHPGTDDEWRDLGLVLVAALCLRLGWDRVEPLAGALLIPAAADEAVPLAAIRAWWDSRCPESLRDLDFMHWQSRLDQALFHVEDCGLWTIDGEQLSLTDFGRDFTIVFDNLSESDMFGE